MLDLPVMIAVLTSLAMAYFFAQCTATFIKKAPLNACLMVTSSFCAVLGPENEKNRGAIHNPVGLSGYATFAEERMFVLNDSKTMEISYWLKLGQSWRG